MPYIDLERFSLCVPVNTIVRVCGNLSFANKGIEGLILSHFFNPDEPAQVKYHPYHWEDPIYNPTERRALKIQFFHEVALRSIEPTDLEYFVRGEWQSFREVMA